MSYKVTTRIMKRDYSSFILLISLLSLSWNSGYSQNNNPSESKLDKNAIYISAGTSILWHGASITYERTHKEKLFNKNISSFAKLGTGYYLMWDCEPNYGGRWVFSNYGWLIGKRAHHFEVSTGMTYVFSGDLKGLLPSGVIGYRYKKPEGQLIFRANASFPEALNLGVGFTF
ncbi:MAG: hypothetical protein HOI49_11410 [Bacteroidetes bacterium]|nr:hypothetical protein [Bacteroidota bacterium]